MQLVGQLSELSQTGSIGMVVIVEGRHGPSQNRARGEAVQAGGPRDLRLAYTYQ
jgi:hypothetical protein